MATGAGCGIRPISVVSGFDVHGVGCADGDLRALARRFDLPRETLRGWWNRFRARSPTLLAEVSAVPIGLDAAPLDLRQAGEPVVFEALGQALHRARRRFGEQRVGDVWRFWSRISGGKVLADQHECALVDCQAILDLDSSNRMRLF